MCYYSRPEWTWEQWKWRVALHSPKLLHHWNLTIRLFSVISRTLIGEWSYTSAEKLSRYSTAPANWTFLAYEIPCLYDIISEAFFFFFIKEANITCWTVYYNLQSTPIRWIKKRFFFFLTISVALLKVNYVVSWERQWNNYNVPIDRNTFKSSVWQAFIFMTKWWNLFL